MSKMKHLKPYNENKIEWTTYRSKEADEYLRDAFVDFINPTDDSKPAEVTHTRVGHNLMLFWIINIPINLKQVDITTFNDRITSTLNDVKECIDKAGDVLNIRHCVEIKNYLTNPCIVVSIWSKDKD